MIAAKNVALVLLAAGRSSRFGAGNKLDQDLAGVPVGMHVVTALADMRFGARIAVVRSNRADAAPDGFAVVRNDVPEHGLSHSLALGIRQARGWAAALVVLADMPCVTAAHVSRLLAAADGPGAIVASSDGERSSPPALFGCDRFTALSMLTGDRGARELIFAGIPVIANPGELIDVDTPAELAALRAVIRGGGRRSG